MSKKSIGIDLDTTLNNLEYTWLELYNKDYNDNLTVEDMVDWDLTKYVKPECGKKIYDYLSIPHLFKRLGIKHYAKEVTELLSIKYDIYIVTAYSYQVCYDKAEWIKEYLPHIDVRNIIFCNDKSKVDLDYLIDDGGHNIEVFKGTPIVFDRPYNRYLEDKFDRVYDWLEIKEYFKL